MIDRADAVALATDLYQMTMSASYDVLGMDRDAVYSMFVRKLPSNRSYLVVAGLEEALQRLTSLRFDDDVLEYLRSTGQVRDDFLQTLASFRFTGEVRAVPEGRVVFPNEPILEVSAPIIQAQLAETLTINAMHYPILVASKAARCVQAANGASLVEFGLRRAPGIEPGAASSRAAYLVGFDGTSNLWAGQQFGIPVSGTVAHSFIQAFPNELDAFRAFARTFPGPVTLLIDTYDTIRGAHHAVQVARELDREGKKVGAVRIDSGDLSELASQVRVILDSAGLQETRIIVSGGLDEHDLKSIVGSGAPIDAYGIGTSLVTSADAPSLDLIYKLVEYDDEPRLKLSTGKSTLAGGKQVWRRVDDDGVYREDRICRRSEPAPGPDWEPLLETVIGGGEIVHQPSLEENRTRHRAEMSRLAPEVLTLTAGDVYSVNVSQALSELQQSTEAAVRSREDVI